MRHLHAVTDAQDRQTARKNCRITLERILIIDAVRSPAENNPLYLTQGLDFRQSHRVGMQLAVDAELPDPPGDQLVILTAEIKNDNLISHRFASFVLKLKSELK